MKRNEKLLAAALGLIVVGYFAWPTIRSIYIDPVRERENQVADLEQQVETKKYDQVQLEVAGRRMAEWRRRGLPGNDVDAQRLYQQWLTDLAEASGLDVEVTPQRRIAAGDVYTAIQVRLEGQATFGELDTFLRRFREADLMHRVLDVDVAENRTPVGDPELRVTLTAEGLNFRGTAARSSLFPQIELPGPLAADAKSISVSAKSFDAKPGDRLRIGGEFVEVSKAEADRLHLTRGADGTQAVDHAAGAMVELFRLRRTDDDESADAVAAIDSPFVKPRIYEPKLDGFADTRLVRGESAKMSVKVAGYDASAGKPTLELVSGPTGLTFDAATGEIAWTPTEEVPSGPHQVTLVADVPAPEKRLEQTITITLADPNTAPTFDAVSPTEIFLGETLKLALGVTDDGGALEYKVEQGPEGASVDPAAGELRWTVPESFKPGEVTFTVVASDKGQPPLSAKQTFSIEVRENLRPFVFLVASIADELQRQAWFWDRSAGRRIVLREGTTFEAGGLTGLTREIGRDFVTYERNGEVWKVGLGRHLGQAEKVGPPIAEAPKPDDPPIEAERPGDAPAITPTPSTAAADPTPPS